jgi:hypothetical protein
VSRDYYQELDGFSVGEVVAVSMPSDKDTRWKIAQLWTTVWCGRVLHLATLICTNPGPSHFSYPRYNRRVGTRKDSTATAWLKKLPHQGEPMKPPTQTFEDYSDSCIHAEVERVTTKCPRCQTQLETEAGGEVHLTDADCIKALLAKLNLRHNGDPSIPKTPFDYGYEQGVADNQALWRRRLGGDFFKYLEDGDPEKPGGRRLP